MTNGGVETLAKSEQKKAPVTVTRGSEPKILSQRIHWIEGTFKGLEPVNLPLIFSQNFVECKPHHGYTLGSRFDDGRELWENPLRPDMGKHWVWSGDACDNSPKEPVAIIKFLHCFGFQFTRIDMATDAQNFNLSARQATKEIENGNCKTRAKECPIRHDAKCPGYTQYVGKLSSEICLRIYDKAEQLGVPGDYTRVELKVGGKRAQKAAWEIVQGRDFRSLVVSFADFPKWREWREVMGADAVKLPAERQTSNTKTWLLRSAASALAKQCILDGNVKFWKEFNDAVQEFHYKMSMNKQTVH